MSIHNDDEADDDDNDVLECTAGYISHLTSHRVITKVSSHKRVVS